MARNVARGRRTMYSGKAGHPQTDALEQHLEPATTLAVRTQSGRGELHPASADDLDALGDLFRQARLAPMGWTRLCCWLMEPDQEGDHSSLHA